MLNSDAEPSPSRRWLRATGAGIQPWVEASAPGALTILMNFQGEGMLTWKSGSRFLLRPGAMVWTRGEVEARRLAGRGRHECLSLHFPDSWIEKILSTTTTEIPPDLCPLVRPPFAAQGSVSRPLTPEDKVWADTAMAPHLCDEARRMLDGARLTEFFLRQLFERPQQTEAFCTRTKRFARERIERVKAAMLERLDEPPSLDQLAAMANCNPHYLSRTFSQVEGLTLSLWLRRARIERAAELIASGRCNVSEAALDVGYRSLSHFSHAFLEEKGVQPSKWVEHLTAARRAD